MKPPFLNLLPREARRNVLLRIRITQWTMIASLCLLIGIVAGLRTYKFQTDVQAEQASLMSAYVPINNMKIKLKTLKLEASQLTKHEEIAQELENQKPMLSLLGVISEAAKKCNQRLQVKSIVLAKVGEKGVGRDFQSSHIRQVLRVQGESLDFESATYFVHALRESGLFAKVLLKSNKATNNGKFSAYAYHVECAYY